MSKEQIDKLVKLKQGIIDSINDPSIVYTPSEDEQALIVEYDFYIPTDKVSAIALLKRIDLKSNDITKECIVKELDSVSETIKKLKLKSAEALNPDGIGMYEAFDDHKGILTENITEKKEHFCTLLAEERKVIEEKYKALGIAPEGELLDEIYKLKIVSGSSYSLSNGNSTSYSIGNSTSINSFDSLSISGGKNRGSTLKIPDPEDGVSNDLYSISTRNGDSNSYTNIYETKSERQNESFSYNFGNSDSTTNVTGQTTSNTVRQASYSYTKARVRNSASIYGMGFSHSEICTAFTLEYGNSVQNYYAGPMFWYWAPIQLSMWGYFSIKRIVNFGYSRKGLYVTGLAFGYTSKANKKIKIYDDFLNNRLSKNDIKKYASVINKKNAKHKAELYNVSAERGDFLFFKNDFPTIYFTLVASGALDTLADNSNETLAAIADAKKKKPGPTKPNFIRSTISVIAYATVGLIWNTVLEVLRRYLPNIEGVNDPNKPNNDRDVISEGTKEEAITGYQAVS